MMIARVVYNDNVGTHVNYDNVISVISPDNKVNEYVIIRRVRGATRDYKTDSVIVPGHNVKHLILVGDR